MTNAELIQKIRNEIERLAKRADRRTDKDHASHNAEMERYGEDYWNGYGDLAYSLLSFLSTLESEKPVNLDDAMKELDEKIALVKQRGTWDGVDVDKYMDEVRGREPEKPMNLEEEINRYLHEECSDDDEPGIHEIAEHFAEWGYLRTAEKYNEIEYNRQRAEESVPKDLEEAAEEYAKLDEDGKWKDGGKYKGFIAGAEWQAEKDARDMYMSDNRHFEKVYQLGRTDMREQMMKEAVEGEISVKFSVVGRSLISVIDTLKDFKYGDKVRVIVLPKED